MQDLIDRKVLVRIATGDGATRVVVGTLLSWSPAHKCATVMREDGTRSHCWLGEWDSIEEYQERHYRWRKA